ncbi:MAG: radical SAM protein [Anaerolineae bacterium]
MSDWDTARRCALCGTKTHLIIEHLGVCGECLRSSFDRARPRVEAAHAETRRAFGLPEAPPESEGGIPCPLCGRSCVIGPGERGYCGLRVNPAVSPRQAAGRGRQDRLQHLAGTAARGVLHWYRDPLPTNCVADWVCAGHQRRGYHNLAVFYASCSLNCLFCQNWHFRGVDPASSEGISARQLADCANSRTFCVCYFGGDPASQMPHALASARYLAERGVTVCWETAGTQHPKLMDRAVQLSLETGGTVKFDLKAFDEGLHMALTGASNHRTLENFARAAARVTERPELPLVVASTLLVPGYITPEEVGRIARFVAAINPHIPYALLGFAPNFYVPDLPRTSVSHAEAALAAARDAGLTNVRIGNRHLLSRDY